MSSSPVILTALNQELTAVQAAIPESERGQVRFIRAGIGWASAVRATQDIMRTGCPRWIAFTGFCGGLVGGLAVGDIVLSDSLHDTEHGLLSVDEKIAAGVRSALKSAGLNYRSGRIACARKPVFNVEEKRALAEASQSIAVDMESFAVAHTIGGKCPVFALRAVSDSSTDALPPEIGGFLDDKGNVRMSSITRFMLGGPRNIKTLMELKARSEKAAAGITAAWKAAWPALKNYPEL